MSKRQQTSDLLPTLSQIPAFAGLDVRLLEQFSGASQLQKITLRQSVFSQGKAISHAHYLLSGLVKRTTRLYDTTEKVLEIIRPGQFIGLAEILSTTAYRSSAKAIQACQVVAIPLGLLVTEAGKHAAMCMELLRIVAGHHHAHEFEAVSHHTLPANQRVLDYLLHLRGENRGIAGESVIQLDAKKRFIAARLDMAPETFSRTLNQLVRDGVIVVKGRNIHIQNAPLVAEQRLISKGQGHVPMYTRQHNSLTMSLTPAALINHCGKLRMLSQLMAVAWLRIACKIDITAARVALRKHERQFDSILAELEAHELPSGLQRFLAAVIGLWPKYRDSLAISCLSADTAKILFDGSEEILDAADRLTAAATTASSSVIARHVNMAGRNRMISVRIAKLHLYQLWATDIAVIRKSLAQTRVEFVDNLAELESFPLNTPEIQAQLALDRQYWQALLVAVTEDTADASAIRNAQVIEASESLLRHSDSTVKLYELLAKTQMH